MEIRWNILLIVIGAAAVTFLPRVLPLIVLSRFRLPDWALRWLSHVPVAIMAALIGQELFTHGGTVSIFANIKEMLAALAAFAVAIKTRSLLGTVVVGILCMMALRWGL